ncbi:hypothetical protein UlMin_000053 [Ulmus minor]
MEQNNAIPSQIHSTRVVKVLRAIRKRKLQAEPLDLPFSKQKCCDRPVSILFEVAKGVEEGPPSDEGSEMESMNDSNSFIGESDTATSVYKKSKMEVEYGKTNDRPASSSYVNRVYDCFEKESLKMENASSSKGELGFLNLEEQLLEFGSHTGYTGAEYKDESMENYTNEELSDVLSANGVNPNVYVLSSGRWTVNQEAASESRKPTIDQEFEQYFSMLML